MTSDRKGLLLALIPLFLWAWPPSVLKYLAEHGYDPWTQNFWRIGASILLLLIWIAGRGQLALVFRRPGDCIPLAITQVTYQYFLVACLKDLSPPMAVFIVQTYVLMAMGAGALLFKDERANLHLRRVGPGLLLSFAGLAGVLFGAREVLDSLASGGGFGFNLPGIAKALAAAVSWAAYSVLIKRSPPGIGASTRFVGAALWTMLIWTPMLFVHGNPGIITHSSPLVLAVLFGSAILFIGIAHPLYFRAIDLAGLSRVSPLMLLEPILASLFSLLLYPGTFTPAQWIGSVAMIGGLKLCMTTPVSSQHPED